MATKKVVKKAEPKAEKELSGQVKLIWTGKNRAFTPGHEYYADAEQAKIHIKKGIAKLA